MLKWIKYVCIRLKSNITDETVVNMFGSTYIVYGNIVKKIKE